MTRADITLPREVVEKALEALMVATTPIPADRHKVVGAIEALRTALAAEQPKQEDIEALRRENERLKADNKRLRRDAERYRWMKQEVKRIPPGWGLVGWDAAIDAAMKEAALQGETVIWAARHDPRE